MGLLGVGEFGAVELVAHRRADETFAMKSSPSEQVSPTRGLQIAQSRYKNLPLKGMYWGYRGLAYMGHIGLKAHELDK